MATTETIEICAKCGQHHPRCKAHRSRRDDNGNLIPCGVRPMKNSRTGVCGTHGGRAPKGKDAPNYRHGRHAQISKLHFLPNAEMADRAAALARDVIENLEESIKIGAMIETRFLEKFGTTESTAAWAALKKACNDYIYDDETPTHLLFLRIERIVDEGLGEAELMKDILVAQEAQRKLTETAVRARKDRSETLTTEQFNVLLSKMIHIINANVTDRVTLKKVHAALEQEYESTPERP